MPACELTRHFYDKFCMQRTQPGAVWQVLSAFSGIPREELTEVKINRPENGLALDHMFHTMFGGLSICFEETEEVRVFILVSALCVIY